MQWSQQHNQISRCLCPSLVCSGSLPSALQLRWLWFPFWSALPKRPRLPRSAPWRAWRPPRVALRWGAMTVRARARARHLMPRASPHCHRTRSVLTFQLILITGPFLTVLQHTYHISSFYVEYVWCCLPLAGDCFHPVTSHYTHFKWLCITLPFQR